MRTICSYLRFSNCLLLLLLLAACSAAPTPTAALPVSASPSPAPTHKPQLPPVPTLVPTLTAEQPIPLPTTAPICQASEPFELARGELQDLAVSPDGRWLAVASSVGVYLHDAGSLAFERALVHGGRFFSLAFSPDGGTLAAGGMGEIRLLDFATGQETRRLQVDYGGNVYRLAFTPDGEGLATVGEGWSGGVQLLSLADGSQQQKAFSTYGNITSLAFSPDGRTLALGADTGRVELFDWQSAARLAILAEPQQETSLTKITDLDFSPDGSLLAAGEESAEGRLRVWSVGKSKRVVEQYAIGHTSTRPAVAFMQDGARLLGGMGDLAIAWERSSGKQTGVLWGYSSMPLDLEISPDGERVAWVTRFGLLLVYPLSEGGQNLALSQPGGYYAMEVTFGSPKNITAGLYNYGAVTPDNPQEMVRLWNAATGDPVTGYLNASAAAYPPDEEIIALADTWGKLYITTWAGNGLCLPVCDCDPAAGFVKPGSCFWQLPHGLSPLKLRYSADGSLLAASGVADGWHAALLWDPAAGVERAWFPGGKKAAFSPTGGLMALPIDEINTDHTVVTQTLVLYDLSEQKILQRSLIPASGEAAFSPDGRWLAVGMSTLEATNPTGENPPDTQKNGLAIWDVANWQPMLYLPVPYGVVALDYHSHLSGAAVLAAGSETGQVLVWMPAPCEGDILR